MKRIVVTGMGCISALGPDRREFTRRLLNGESGIGPITSFDPGDSLVRIAAEVKDYDGSVLFPEKQLSQLDRFAQFALVATREAVTDAGLDFKGSLSGRTAVVHGTGVGGQGTQEAGYHRMFALNEKRIHPFTVPKLMPSAGTSWISMEFGITGPAFATTSACASSGHAIGMAMLILRTGMADVAVTGGSEACVTMGTIKAWERLRVMAKDTCRPFCRTRGGMVIGEGAGTLVLETLEHAQARGAKIYAELAGFGMSADAHNLIQPLADGAARAMRAALDDAGLSPDAVDYINAHGTATAQNDPTETEAIHAVFGRHAKKLAVSSTKSMHGHTLGASSALEAIASIVGLNEQTAPPTANFREPDPQCDLDYVPNTARPMPINAALSNSFAFGGLNTSLLFRRY
ncbi:MAG: beta-ketoacyl-[acyl-carrier-protein] synthase family protein [Nitrospiraceae bacterium]|nr:MAG: beta-ketoacyl-[acyl-carrier-protein] synthase family protein [Nitrospiraceae bacterium]